MSEYAVLNNDNVVVEENRDSNGMKVGYNLCIVDADVAEIDAPASSLD